MSPLWYPDSQWRDLPTAFFNDHELQPPSAVHDVPLPSDAADDEAPHPREYETQPPTERGQALHQEYLNSTSRRQWLHDYVARSGAKDRESLMLHAAREFGNILAWDLDFKSRLGHAEYRYRNGAAKHLGRRPWRPRRENRDGRGWL